MRVLIAVLVCLVASPALAADYSEWHRDAYRVFSRLEDAREALKEFACADSDCEAQATELAERVEVMIGRVESVAESEDLTDSEGNVYDDGNALCKEVDRFTSE